MYIMDLGFVSTAQLVLVASFTISALVLRFGRKTAETAGLIDKPNNRKLHNGHVPLLGGIAISLSLLAITPLTISSVNMASIVTISLMLGMLGAIDDAKDLSAAFRFLCQLLAGITLATWGEVRVVELGNILGFGEIKLDYWASLCFTAFCIVGIINAINMIDGIDGLFGGVSLLILVAMSFICYSSGQLEAVILCFIVIGGLSAFLAFNLGIFGTKLKVFSGDSGSMAIGFMVAAILVYATQGKETSLNPVAAGWLLGLPIMDTARVMVIRALNKKSPFSPARDHLHHLLIDQGVSPRKTLALLLLLQLVAVGGACLAMSRIFPDAVMFWLFVCLTICHFLFSPKLAKKLSSYSISAQS